MARMNLTRRQIIKWRAHFPSDGAAKRTHGARAAQHHSIGAMDWRADACACSEHEDSGKMHRRVRIALGIVAILAWLGIIGILAACSEGFIPQTARQLLLAAFVIGPLLVFGEAILEAIFHVVAYGAGRVLLPIVTLGRFRAETLGEDLTFPWHGIKRLPSGTCVLSLDATSIFGLIILALGGAALCYAYL